LKTGKLSKLQTCWEDPYIITIIIIRINDVMPVTKASQAKMIVAHMDRLALYLGATRKV